MQWAGLLTLLVAAFPLSLVVEHLFRKATITACPTLILRHDRKFRRLDSRCISQRVRRPVCMLNRYADDSRAVTPSRCSSFVCRIGIGVRGPLVSRRLDPIQYILFDEFLSAPRSRPGTPSDAIHLSARRRDRVLLALFRDGLAIRDTYQGAPHTLATAAINLFFLLALWGWWLAIRQKASKSMPCVRNTASLLALLVRVPLPRRVALTGAIRT